jgi:sodium/hydrogen antiporter
LNEGAVAVLALLVVGWALISGVLARHNVTGPIVFSVAGFLLANPDWGPIAIDIDTAGVHTLAEVTLALVLFSDAARVNFSALRHDAGFPTRLLGIGLPLSMVLGGVLAALMFGDFSWALAGYVAATLAPTDAALSAQVINDQRVPRRLRRVLNVESGLNDGIATPLVTLTLALVAVEMGIEAESESAAANTALLDLALGTVAGIVLGTVGAVAINHASRRGWIVTGGRRLATLGLAVAAFTATVAMGGNGLIAAFVSGLAYGAALDKDAIEVEHAVILPELGGELLALVVWFLFGATLIPIGFAHLDVSVIGYALLSLTVIRILPVVLALVGAGLKRTSVLFVGWFGPRGLASVVFALLALEELGDGANEAVAVVAITVLLSVILHGVTSGPGGAIFSEEEVETDDHPEEEIRARASGFLDRRVRSGESAEPEQ